MNVLNAQQQQQPQGDILDNLWAYWQFRLALFIASVPLARFSVEFANANRPYSRYSEIAVEAILFIVGATVVSLFALWVGFDNSGIGSVLIKAGLLASLVWQAITAYEAGASYSNTIVFCLFLAILCMTNACRRLVMFLATSELEPVRVLRSWFV